MVYATLNLSVVVVAPPEATKPLSDQWQIQTDTRVPNISLSLSFSKTRLYFHFWHAPLSAVPLTPWLMERDWSTSAKGQGWRLFFPD